MNDINEIFFEGQCKRETSDCKSPEHLNTSTMSEESQACLNSAECSLSSIFYQLIRVAIGTQETLSRLPSEAEWEDLFEMAVKQSLVGVCFAALQHLGADADEGYARIGMSEGLYFDWMGTAAQINMKNELVNRQCVEVQQRIENAGFRTFIMKGQGNAVLYNSSEDLSLFRQSGDIDIYLDGGFKKVNDFVQKTCPTNQINELEIHYHCLEDTEVEIHYRPFIMRSPLKNARLQKFFKETINFDNKVALPNGAGEINVPTAEFNLVHQMVHIFHHMLIGGIGMRQLMDYFFLLRSVPSSKVSSSKIQGVIHDLGLDRFASALMWMLGYVFTSTSSAQVQKEDYMLWKPDEKDGKFLLNEVMLSGNFGNYDDRLPQHRTKWQSFWMLSIHNLRLLRFDKTDWFWGPLWRLYHYLWRKSKGFK